jgi:hypothetical protein
VSKRIRRTELGDQVFDCLTRIEPTLEEALQFTGLTAAQWHSGLAYIREVLAEVHHEPVVWDAKTRRYALASLESEVDAYIGKRVNQFLISLHRIYDGTFWPAGVKFETRKTARFQQIDTDVKRLITQLEWAREDLGVPESVSLARRGKAREAAGLSGTAA